MTYSHFVFVSHALIKRVGMKKITVTLILVLLCSPFAFAKTGGPIENVGKGKFALSIDTEYIPEQRMRQHKIYSDNSSGGTIEESAYMYDNIKFRLDSHSLNLSYGILDNLEVFLKAGVNKIKFSMREDEFGSGSSFIDAIGDYNPMLGGGFKIHLFSIGELFDVGFSGEYLWSKGKLKRYNAFSGSELHVDVMSSKVKYYSWGGSLYFYKHFKFITPYIGAKYQDSLYDLKADLYIPAASLWSYIDSFKFEQDMPWIMFWGIDFHINKRLDANIELSTFGSRSASFGVTWKF